MTLSHPPKACLSLRRARRAIEALLPLARRLRLAGLEKSWTRRLGRN